MILNQNQEEIVDFLKMAFPDSCYVDNPYIAYFGYYQNEEIIGAISYSIMYDRIELNYIYVVEKERKKGIGKLLMQELLRIAVEKRAINITLEVEKENIAAISLYKNCGFLEVAIRSNYYQGNDGILMMKEVS